jgi:hypothetical protein
MAFFPEINIDTEKFVGLDIGRYLLDSSNADEPVSLIIDVPSIKPQGRSYASVVFSDQENQADGLPDIQCQVRTSFSWDSGVTQTTLEELLTRSGAFLTSANLAKLLRGER